MFLMFNNANIVIKRKTESEKRKTFLELFAISHQPLAFL
jgi:hypothetical protein